MGKSTLLVRRARVSIDPTGSGGATGATGSPGGATGATGAAGSPGGATGATGPAGGGAIVNFANFFALMPGDNAATIAVGAAIQFPQTGPTAGVSPPTRVSASTFNLPNVGIYEVTWQASITEAGQLQLSLAGVGLPNTVVGRATGTNQIFGSTIINNLAPNQVLSVINPPGNSTALTMTVIAGGTHSVSATLSIKQLS
jgi:hypothetical protein